MCRRCVVTSRDGTEMSGRERCTEGKPNVEDLQGKWAKIASRTGFPGRPSEGFDSLLRHQGSRQPETAGTRLDPHRISPSVDAREWTGEDPNRPYGDRRGQFGAIAGQREEVAPKTRTKAADDRYIPARQPGPERGRRLRVLRDLEALLGDGAASGYLAVGRRLLQGLAKQADPNSRTIAGGPHRCRHTFASHFSRRSPTSLRSGASWPQPHARDRAALAPAGRPPGRDAQRGDVRGSAGRRVDDHLDAQEVGLHLHVHAVPPLTRQAEPKRAGMPGRSTAFAGERVCAGQIFTEYLFRR